MNTAMVRLVTVWLASERGHAPLAAQLASAERLWCRLRGFDVWLRLEPASLLACLGVTGVAVDPALCGALAGRRPIAQAVAILHLNGYTSRETGAAVGLSRAAVRQRWHRMWHA